MAYYTDEELKRIGFKSIGKDIKISNKASIYNPSEIEIGDYSRIDDFCVISGKVKLGRNVHIAPHCLVAGGSEGVVFGIFLVWLILFKCLLNRMTTLEKL